MQIDQTAIDKIADSILKVIEKKLSDNNTKVVSNAIKNHKVDGDHIVRESIGNVHIKDAAIDTAKIKDLTVEIARIAVAEIGTAIIDVAQIDQLSATVANIVNATIQSADIEWADIANLTATIAAIAVANIETARIDFAQIDGLVAGVALIQEAVGGKVQIADLSVSDANIVTLNANKITAGTLSVDRLVIVGSTQSIVYAVNEANGTAQLSQTTIDGGSITRKTITADQIIAHGITADCLNVAEIFANEALVGAITAESAIIADGAITTAKIGNAQITSAKIADANITTAKIGDLQVTGAKIADANITTAKIADAQITGAKIANATITNANIAEATINTANIGNGQITTAKIGDAQITTAKIGDAQITNAKINDLDAAKINAGTLSADRIAAGSITTDKLDASAVTAEKIDTDSLFSSQAYIESLQSEVIKTDTIQGIGNALTGQQSFIDFADGRVDIGVANKTDHVSETPPSGDGLYLNRFWTIPSTGERLRWKAIVEDSSRKYSATKSGAAVAIEDLSDDRSMSVTVKSAIRQSTTPTLGNQQPITGRSNIRAIRTAKNVLPPGTTQTIDGVTFTFYASGTISISGTCTAAAGAARLCYVPMDTYLHGDYVLWLRNEFTDASLQIRLMQSEGVQVSAVSTNLDAGTYSAWKAFALTNQYIWGYALRIEGGKTYDVTIRPSLEPGTVRTAFEQYVGAEYTFTSAAPLYGVAGAEDEISSGGTEIHKTKYLRVDGTESWGLHGTQPTLTTLARFVLSVADIKPGALGISSAFGWTLYPGAGTASEAISGHPSSQQINIFVMKSRVAGSSGTWSDAWTSAQKVAWFKAICAAYPFDVVYEIATPSTTSVVPIQINGVDGLNVVSSNSESVTVSYTGSGWQLTSNKANGLYASANMKFDADGLEITQTSIDGKPVATKHIANSEKSGIFRTSDEKMLQGAKVLPDGRVVGVSGALIDPDGSGNSFLSVKSGNESNGERVELEYVAPKFAGVTPRVTSDSPASNGSKTAVRLYGANYPLWNDTTQQYDDRTVGYFVVPGELDIRADSHLTLFGGETSNGLPGISIGCSDGWFNIGTLIHPQGAADFSCHVIPTINNTYALGSTAYNKRWSNAYLSAGPDSLSDERAKQDIEDIPKSCEILLALRPKQFRMKDNPDQLRYGFVWQEVREVFRSLGIEDAAVLGDNPDDDEQMHGLLYSEFIGMLVAGYQSQQYRIDALESEVSELKSYTAALEARLTALEANIG